MAHDNQPGLILPSGGEGQGPFITPGTAIFNRSANLNRREFEAGFLRNFSGRALLEMATENTFDDKLEERLNEYRRASMSPESEYNHLEDPRWSKLPKHMWDYATEAKSRGEADIIFGMLQKQLAKEARIHDSGYFGDIGMLTGLLISESPVLPLSGSIGLMVGFPSLTAFNEALLQTADPVRSGRESVMNIGMSAAAGVGIAAIQAGLRANRVRIGARKQEDLAVDIDTEIRNMETGQGPDRSATIVRETVEATPTRPVYEGPPFGQRTMPEPETVPNTVKGILDDVHGVSSREGMGVAIGKMEEAGALDKTMAQSMRDMVAIMPERLFEGLRIGANRLHAKLPLNEAKNLAGVYYYFEDLVALFGVGIARQSRKGRTTAGEVLSHELGHRVMFSMATDAELVTARKLFDNFVSSDRTAARLENYPNSKDHFSEWFAFEFQDYWMRVLKDGNPKAITFMERAYAKDAVGLANLFDKIIVKMADLTRRISGSGKFEPTQAQMVDTFFVGINKRLGKGQSQKTIDAAKEIAFSRGVAFERGDTPLSGGRGSPGAFDDLLDDVNFSGAAYSRVSAGKPFENQFRPDGGESMLPAWFLEKLGDSPVKRLLQSDDSFVRHIVSYLVEHPFYQRMNTTGKITPHGVDRNIAIEWFAPMFKAMEETDAIYARYRQRHFDESGSGAPPGGGVFVQGVTDTLKGRGGALSRQEFMREVGRAKIRMERPNEFGDNILPEAIEAAQVWNTNLFKRAGEQAQELQVFSIRQRRRLDVVEKQLQQLMDGTSALGMTVKQLRFADDLQKQIKQLKKEIQEADHFVLDPNYFPRLWNQRVIREKRAELNAILVREGGYTPAEAAAKIDTILEGKAFQAIEDDATGMARSLKEREIDVDTIHVEDFIELNVASVGRYYASRMGADIELTRAFGSIDLKEIVTRIRETADEAIFAADPKFAAFEKSLLELDVFERGSIIRPKMNKAGEKLVKDRDGAIRDIQAIRDRIRGTYGIPDDPTTWTNRGIRVAKMWNATSLLTGALAAVPDLGKIIMADGLTRTIGPMLEAFKSDIGFLKTARLARNEAEIAGEALDMYMSMRSALFADLADSLSAATPFERGAANLTQQFFNFSLMNQWNVAAKTLASLTVGSRIIRESDRLLNGTISKTELTKLSNIGIDEITARFIVEQSRKHGMQGEHLHIPKTEKWDKTPGVQAAAKTFSSALGKDINRIIVTPGKGDTPLFMSKPIHSLIFQFKTFAIAAMHRTLVPGLQLRDANFLMGNIALVGLGGLVHEIRNWQLGISHEEAFADWLLSSMERGGNAGIITDLNASLETLSDHRMGLRPMLGAATPYNTSGVAKGSALGGPIVQQGSNLARVIWDLGPGEGDTQTANSFRRLLWGAKAFHTNAAYDVIEDGIATLID
jgi:hypothetical protein